MDPNDHLIEYYIAMNCACRGQVLEAMIHVKNALKLCPEHAPSLHLMILLLTAQKQYSEASALLLTSLMDFPDSLDFHYLKAHLELHTQGGDVSFELFIKFQHYQRHYLLATVVGHVCVWPCMRRAMYANGFFCIPPPPGH